MGMKWRKGLFLALLLAVGLLVLLPGRPALADEEFLPARPPAMVDWSEPPLYERYPAWHYVYGARIQGPDTLHRLIYTMNLLQVGKAWILKLALRSVEYAVSFDLAGPLVARAGVAMRALVGALWQADQAALVVAGLLMTGALALWYGAFRARLVTGLRILAGAAIILVGSYALFEVAPQTLVNSASIARALGSQVLAGAAAAVAPAGSEGTAAQRLLRSAGESAWRAFVHDPWIDGEFTADAAAKPDYADGEVEGGRWLALSPSVRLNRYNFMNPTSKLNDFSQWDTEYAVDYLPRRFTLVLVSGAVTLVYAGALLLLSGGILYYQLLLVAMLALAPVWLLLALWHPGGLAMVRGAVVRAVGALVAQVVLLAVLAVLLALTGPLASLAEPLGWSARAMLLALLGAVLYRYRFRWLHWGRETGETGAVREQPTLLERLVLRRSGAGERAVQPSAPIPAAAPALGALPSFALERPSLGFAPEPGESEGADAPGRGGVVAEVAEEMRRLRARLSTAEADPQVLALQRLGELHLRREMAASASEPVRGAAPGGGQGAAGAAPASRSAARPAEVPLLRLYQNKR
jgi:hypothetical protein